MPIRLLLLVPCCFFLLALRAAELTDAELEAAMAQPAATGLLVLGVGEGSPAQAKGLRRGDIVVSYNGAELTSADALRAAIGKASESNAKTIKLAVVRGGAALAFELEMGPLGLRSIPVVKGRELRARPPATGASFDLAALKDRPLDLWYDFRIGGKKAGFEHHILKLEGGKLLLTSEVAFDPGPDAPLPQHFLVTVEASAEALPRVLKATYAFPPGQFLCEGALEETAGRRLWRFKAAWMEKDAQDKESAQSHAGELPAPPDLLTDYLLVALAGAFPRKPGSCAHFTNLNIGTGDAADPSALLAAAEEELETPAGRLKTVRLDQHAWAQVTRSTWVDAQGRAVKNVYGPGAESWLVTREQALANLPARIKPKAP